MTSSFWSKALINEPDECWPWQGAVNVRGYGNFRSRSAHRVAYELVNGTIPVGLTIDHLCANHGCVNPAHLEAVTIQENIRRHVAKTTHCKRGHLLSGDNVKIIRRTDGTRRKCRACNHIYKTIKYREAHG